jgi:hypothetical protein
MISQWTRRQFICRCAAAVGVSLPLPQRSVAQIPAGASLLENQYLKYVVGPDARSLQFLDQQTGGDHCSAGGRAAMARIQKAGRQYDATSARNNQGQLMLRFGDSGVQAVLKTIVHPRHLVLEVLSLSGAGVDEFTFINVPLGLQGVE